MNPSAAVTSPVAAVYLRVSTDEQTVENQRAPLLELCARRGWTPRVFEEVESGAKRSRPALDAMIAAAQRGEVCAVVIVALDRLGRSLANVLDIFFKLDAARVPVVSHRDNWLESDGPQRSLLISIFSWVAEQERRVLIERTRAGLARARRQGTKLGRRTVETDPKRAEQAERLRRALDLISRGGHPPAVARDCRIPLRTLKRRLASTLCHECNGPCRNPVHRVVVTDPEWRARVAAKTSP